MKKPIQSTKLVFEQSRDRLDEILELLETPDRIATTQELQAAIAGLARIVRNHMLVLDGLVFSPGAVSRE